MITISNITNTLEKQNFSIQLFYTQDKYFASILRDVESTNLIIHFINFKQNDYPFYSKILYYTKKKWEFCDFIFPEIEKADIIT